MAEMIRQMEELVGRRTELQEVRAAEKLLRRNHSRSSHENKSERLNAIKMKVTREEMLEIYRSWSTASSRAGSPTKRKKKTWRGWEVFGEFLGPKRQSDGRSPLRVGSWNPKSGCWVEEEMEQEAWVKIFGLPISLWSPVILKKIGEECGGFVEIDEQTRGGGILCALWWEIRPVVRRISLRRKTEGEMRSGVTLFTAEKRVGKELVDAGTEELYLPDDGRYVLISILKEKGYGEPFFSLLILIGLRRGSLSMSRGIEEELWGDKSTWLTVYEGNVENENRSRKLGEANKNRDKVRGKEGNTGASGSQDTENEKEDLGRTIGEPKCGGGYGWHFDMLGQEGFGYFGLGGGSVSLSCRFKTTENGATWVFTGVYGPFTKVEREGMWEEFGAIRGLWDDPWCLGGDFNITLFQQERNSQRRISSAMRRFAETVDDLELVDLLLLGGEFTWNGGLIIRRGQTRQIFSFPSWLDQFSGVTQSRIKVNGEWLVEEQEVREGVVNSFQQMLSEDMAWQADIGRIQVGCISQQEAESLEIPLQRLRFIRR
ncbi:hypothetical protein CK203_000147 [Vitis vinifera]|uniref:Uncharacterized protein n=1 Tax=Vitis vinifera TaxID=29760 RepID=A0A438KR82_VITVI|nr:hypothetical protein CK203_000147 [Vitis vinifera]